MTESEQQEVKATIAKFEKTYSETVTAIVQLDAKSAIKIIQRCEAVVADLLQDNLTAQENITANLIAIRLIIDLGYLRLKGE